MNATTEKQLDAATRLVGRMIGYKTQYGPRFRRAVGAATDSEGRVRLQMETAERLYFPKSILEVDGKAYDPATYETPITRMQTELEALGFVKLGRPQHWTGTAYVYERNGSSIRVVVNDEETINVIGFRGGCTEWQIDNIDITSTPTMLIMAIVRNAKASV